MLGGWGGGRGRAEAGQGAAPWQSSPCSPAGFVPTEPRGQRAFLQNKGQGIQSAQEEEVKGGRLELAPGQTRQAGEAASAGPALPAGGQRLSQPQFSQPRAELGPPPLRLMGGEDGEEGFRGSLGWAVYFL